MKVRTSVTLSKELLLKLNELAVKHRSEIIETALEDYFKKKSRQQRDVRELEILNRDAEKLNKEALDVLEYQVNW